jgi:carbonic anhydrase
LNPPESNREIKIKPNMAPTLLVKAGPLKGTWNLEQFHFHQLSEHTLNGNHSDMELHLVHSRPDPTKPGGKDYLAVGRFIETIGMNNNALLNDVFSNLDTIQIPLAPPAPHYVSGALNLKDLVPTDLSSYRYSGSLTTGPPVSDTAVNWIVLREPLGLTAAQIAAFRNHASRGTVRKVWEPLELAAIGLPSHPNVTFVPEPSTVWLLMTAGLVTARRRRRSCA